MNRADQLILVTGVLLTAVAFGIVLESGSLALHQVPPPKPATP